MAVGRTKNERADSPIDVRSEFSVFSFVKNGVFASKDVGAGDSRTGSADPIFWGCSYTTRIFRNTQRRRSVIEWFDDLGVGMRFKSQEKVITCEEIKRFASEFDPQPFHLDEAAAEQTPLRGLAASGWHTAAIAMRLAVEVRPFRPSRAEKRTAPAVN
jgi:hypothetical protein